MPRKGESGLTKVQEEFAAWMLLGKRERELHGLPNTQAGWADWKGVAERTVRRWKDKPEFQTFLEQRRIARARELTPNSTVTPEDVGGARAVTHGTALKNLQPPAEATDADDPLSHISDPMERGYLEIKDELFRQARNGEKGAVELVMKYWGRSYLEAENADGGRLVDLSDDELAREVVELLGVDTVTNVLADLMTTA